MKTEQEIRKRIKTFEELVQVNLQLTTIDKPISQRFEVCKLNFEYLASVKALKWVLGESYD